MNRQMCRYAIVVLAMVIMVISTTLSVGAKAPSGTTASPSGVASDGIYNVREQSLRFMTYNIQIGARTAVNPTWNPALFDLAGVADVIASQNADVVILQEVDRNRPRSGGVDQVKWLAERLGYPYYALAPAYRVMENNGIGEYGNAILSRIPFADLRIVNLEHRTNKAGRVEPRSCFVATLQTEPVVHVMGVHLSIRADERVYPLQQITTLIREVGYPIVLMGDFNADHTELLATDLPYFVQDLLASNPIPTFPNGSAAASSPDHVWVSPDWEVQAVWVVSERLGRSDHNPIVTDLKLAGE